MDQKNPVPTATEPALTSMAAFLLPYGVKHHECGVILLRHKEANRTILITPGGYRQNGESAHDCVRRNLRNQLGMETNDVRASVARVRGHHDQERIIQCFTTQDFRIVSKPAPGHERVQASLQEALGWAFDGRYADDATTIQIFALYTELLAQGLIKPLRFH